ncbi:type II toxin-antitoxin system VapC family toxin [Nocardia asteroides]|uniref:type II toxin-antitoxin system VapC family toxin n=1 Tax=Nocardia asteroides TaxID=1824 RepID=UPI001E5A490E|nr:type II toxin-antitoxin system VapC family toxin [Nocardia asteroides]UGT57401.1 type II toxin-antitoxin system VapC family toxin [Nocardia asteroides]
MIVVDASVFAHALLNPGPLGDRCRAALEADNRWIAPQHWTIEVLSVIRRFTRAGTITAAQAAKAVTALEKLDPEVPVTRVLVPRIWQLRDNLTAYDAAYVAAAETYGCELLTADTRLANAPGITCRVRLLDDLGAHGD